MKTRAILALVAVAGVAAAANAQAPGLEIRFPAAGGANNIVVAPNSPVLVEVWAVNLPIGAQMAWTTQPGTGQMGTVVGFESVLFNMNATDGTWSGLAANLAAGLSPLSTPGTIANPNINNINLGVAFQPPIAQVNFKLWEGTITVGNANVNLNTDIRPVGNPPYTGISVYLNVGLAFPVQHFLTNSTNGNGTIVIPAPASLALLGLGGLVATRRRR